MSDNSIRPISPNDFDAIYDLYMDETVNPFMLHDPMDKTGFRRIFDEFLRRDYSWLIEEDGKICGMCFANKGVARCRHIATLRTLAVSKEAQGRGIGKRLVNEAMRVLKQDGFLRIDLMVEADNDKAIAFYKKIGFQTDGRLPMYFQRRNESGFVDEFLMSITYGQQI